jgi:TPR repeat protein
LTRILIKYVTVAVVSGLLASCSSLSISSQARFAKALDEESAGSHATNLFEESCKSGERAACTRVGKIKYQKGEREAAIKYFKQGCEMGDPYGCDYLGAQYFGENRFNEARPKLLRF